MERWRSVSLPTVEAIRQFRIVADYADQNLERLASEALGPILSEQDVYDRAIYTRAYTSAARRYLEPIFLLAKRTGQHAATENYLHPQMVEERQLVACEAYAANADAFCTAKYGAQAQAAAKNQVRALQFTNPSGLKDLVLENNRILRQEILTVTGSIRKLAEFMQESEEK